ncbi:MAG: outer membrane beta-barrel protein [Acidobacteria bacterium]|nr:outer membrane beta-barrel protein [Acidobacteriota bacterium]
MLVICGPAFAQIQAPAPPPADPIQSQDPWEQARVRIGPLAFTPSFLLKNLGWDTNVFNELVNPKKDFTVTAGGLVNWWLRAGDMRLIGSDSLDGMYFATYASQRAMNHSHSLRIEYRGNRLRPYALGSYSSIKDRPGYEIDTRARHTETALGGGLDMRLAGKTRLDFAGRRTTYAFARGETFAGTTLAHLLNQKGTFGIATLRYAATPLTTLTLLGEYGQERFDESLARNNDSYRVMAGVELDPFALIKGSAKVGYRRVNMISPTIPDFAGLVAEVNLSYVLLGQTRFGVGVNREPQFSYSVTQPYYVLTGVTGSVRQGLGLGWDVEARGATQQLAYRQVSGITESVAGRVDRVHSYGGGIGYRLSPGIRMGANVDYYQRRSVTYGSAYKTLRYGLAATYEF